jgi:HSP20 family molecular chaperone IbpA
MNCPVCGTRIEKEWGFCPRCGSRISGDFFDEIFSRMRKELAEMNKLLEKDIEAFDLSPWFRDMDKRKNSLKEGEQKKEGVSGRLQASGAFRPKFQPKSTGFTIKIVQSGGKPEVSVRTFGDVDKSKLRKEMDELGVWQPGLEKEEAAREARPAKPQEKLVIKGPMRTEEPKTSVAKSASKVVVSIHLPDVKSDHDIEISDLESSVEVKALAEDRAYFKILTKPSQFRLARKSFEKGVLHLEFS